MKHVTIKEMASTLQRLIDLRLQSFNEDYDKLKAINTQVEAIEKKMLEIIIELEPVESLIYNQNPQLEKIFESLKRIYKEDEDGTDREVN
jgi:flagellar biosynthesis chaperone FliJ